MPIHLKDLSLLRHPEEMNALPSGKLLINTINAHCYNLAQKDALYAEALANCDVLIPDGISIVKSVKLLQDIEIERVAGWDFFLFEMKKLNAKGGVCFFLGSSHQVLALIKKKAAVDYPKIRIVGYSPPFKPDFTKEEDNAMIKAINAANPDLLWIGMTAPKQEKWTYTHWNELKINCHVGAIGAVFDFYAGTVNRAPLQWQKQGLEWLHRLIKEPRRMWKRYLIGNVLFIYYILKEKFYQINPDKNDFDVSS